MSITYSQPAYSLTTYSHLPSVKPSPTANRPTVTRHYVDLQFIRVLRS
ncbi:hypothetical protein HOU26_gp01 [Escherichia phage IMM-002]|uniref:Uncharacterized protein n=1 Tax=Escherichia phage IMM-002 TaxID=2041760 RepID=A0A384WW36_9CAUD|nr:hypothetical protein HOU26_gp01 [Escherichia phage IMM-002]ATI16960.1 hypothetical protein [Escherichia phage IMM-002]